MCHPCAETFWSHHRPKQSLVGHDSSKDDFLEYSSMLEPFVVPDRLDSTGDFSLHSTLLLNKVDIQHRAFSLFTFFQISSVEHHGACSKRAG